MSMKPTAPAFDGKAFVARLSTAPGVYRMLAADGGTAWTSIFDVTDWDAVEAAVAERGPYDILVNISNDAGKTFRPNPQRADSDDPAGSAYSRWCRTSGCTRPSSSAPRQRRWWVRCPARCRR